MARRMRDHDWAGSPLGPVDEWSPALRTALVLCLGSRVPVLVWWGSERVLFYNDACVALVGFDARLGAPGSSAGVELWRAVGAAVEIAFAAAEPGAAEIVALKLRHGITDGGDGSERADEVLFSVCALPGADDGIEGVCCVAERNPDLSTGALRERERWLRRVIEIETVGIAFFRVTGAFVEANDTFLRLTGYTRDDLAAGRVRWDTMTPPHCLARSLRAMTEFHALGRTTPYEKEYVRKDGTRWRALVAAARLSDDEGVEYAIDITQRKAADEELQQHRKELELSVQERTAELDAMNGALRDEIIERRRGEDSRQDLLRQIVSAQEEERRRISRELHDEVGQHLAALMLGLKSLEDRPADASAIATLRQLQEITELVGREVHEMALNLRPTALDDLGLSRTLSNYLEEWSARSRVPADFHSALDAGERLPSHLETTLYRIVQEALTNVLKHARATRVSVIVERRGDQVIAIVEDNGGGFETQPIDARSSSKRLGLLGMKERAALVDGELSIESTPGRGTTIFVRIPCAKKP